MVTSAVTARASSRTAPSFGTGDTDWSESITEFLNGPPRIAPLWDDLSPNQGGTVSVEWDDTSMTVNFEDVPEFFGIIGYTFSVVMHASGDVDIVYGTPGGNDDIVGLTEGNGAADPGPTDLSAAGAMSFSQLSPTIRHSPGWRVNRFNISW